MPLTVQLALLLVLALVAGFTVPLLVQLRRTAAAVERLAEQAARDLGRVAEDVHGMKVQVDEVAALARATLKGPAEIGQTLSECAAWVDSLRHGGMAQVFKVGLNLVRGLFARRPSGPASGEGRTA